MMSLHLDKKEFKKVISLISDETGIRRDIIEKDYYVTMILKELFNKEPNLVFKGGTSLSKCFHAIDRFSEDIDINYIDHQTLNRTRKKKIKETLKEVVALCKLSIVNLEETRSNRIFNQYKIEYPKSFEFTSCVVDKVIVETGFQSPSFPCVKMMAQSMIGEFIMERGSNELMKKYDLEPFEVTVQSLERTFIDKLFATAEYYLRKKVTRYSRHLYDIHMLYSHIKFDDYFYGLFDEVKKLRENIKYCINEDEGISLTEILTEILENDYYKDDYNLVTLPMCYTKVPYEKAKETLMNITLKLKNKCYI